VTASRAIISSVFMSGSPRHPSSIETFGIEFGGEIEAELDVGLRAAASGSIQGMPDHVGPSAIAWRISASAPRFAMRPSCAKATPEDRRRRGTPRAQAISAFDALDRALVSTSRSRGRANCRYSAAIRGAGAVRNDPGRVAVGL